MNDYFHGNGYSQAPLSKEEAAKFRHMFLEVTADWLKIRKIITLIDAVNVLYGVFKIGGPVLVALAAAGYILKTQGLI